MEIVIHMTHWIEVGEWTRNEETEGEQQGFVGSSNKNV